MGFTEVNANPAVAVISLILEVLDDVVKLSVHPPGRSLGIRVRVLHPVYSCAVTGRRRYFDVYSEGIFKSHCGFAGCRAMWRV